MGLEYLLFNLVFALAGFTQGLTGFGLALVAVPVLGLFVDLKFVVPLTILHGVILTGYLSQRLRGHVDWRKIMPLLLGSLPGVVVGAVVLQRVDVVFMKILLGILVAGYGAYSLRRRLLPRSPIAAGWGYLAGFLTGVIGTVFSAGGPPTIIYTTLTGWNKDAIKATLSAFFFTNGIAMVTAHWWAGLTTTSVAIAWVCSLPGLCIGLIAGARLYDRVDHVLYLRLVAWGLIGMGAMLLFNAWQGGW